MTAEEALSHLREGFSDDYWAAFGSLVAVQREPDGVMVCPACEKPCSPHFGHPSCQHNHRAAA